MVYVHLKIKHTSESYIAQQAQNNGVTESYNF